MVNLPVDHMLKENSLFLFQHLLIADASSAT